MAIFRTGDKLKLRKDIHSTTIITKCMHINGNIEGCGMIHIDGTIYGDLIIDKNIIIGRNGSVYGNIKSKKVIISGKLEGSISCDTLEISKTAQVSDKIVAKDVIIDGRVDATLLVDNSISITKNGCITTEHMQAKYIDINGHIDGNVIAMKLLEINKFAEVKGKMLVKKIKVIEGGLMLGTMLTYDSVDEINASSSKPDNEHNKGEIT